MQTGRKVKTKKIERVMLLSTLLLIISAFGYRWLNKKDTDEKLKNSKIIMATVDEYSEIMGTPYINYHYTIIEKKYNGSAPASKVIKIHIPEGVENLRIKYSLESPELSIIVDKRYTK